jgi:hypothetical protein
MALPNRPPASVVAEGVGEATQSGSAASIQADAAEAGYVRLAHAHPVLWMVAAPVLLASLVVGLTIALTPRHAPKPARHDANAKVAAPVATVAEPSGVQQRQATVEELEARPVESLSATELLRVADGRAQRRLTAARALAAKLEQEPALSGEKSTQVELLRLARDGETAREGLGALARLKSPLGADLLYEVWTGTAVHTDATELARALVYSSDVREHASAALAVALDLRVAEGCEAFKTVLPRALKDGDRRALGQLTKLVAKRGCGPKKNEDCYACLRGEPDELSATINAAKSRRPPAYPAP